MNTQKLIFSTFTTYFTVQLTTLNCISNSWLHGLMDSIAAFQAVDPGSIPVRVMYFIHIFSFYNIYFLKIPIKNYIKVTPPNIYYAINMLIYKCIIRNLQKKSILIPNKLIFLFYDTFHPIVSNKIDKQKIQNGHALQNMLSYKYIIKNL